MKRERKEREKREKRERKERKRERGRKRGSFFHLRETERERERVSIAPLFHLSCFPLSRMREGARVLTS